MLTMRGIKDERDKRYEKLPVEKRREEYKNEGGEVQCHDLNDACPLYLLRRFPQYTKKKVQNFTASESRSSSHLCLFFGSSS